MEQQKKDLCVEQAWDDEEFQTQLKEISDEFSLKHVKRAREAFNKYKDALNQGLEGWKLISDKNDVKSYSSPGEAGVIRIKAMGDIPFSPQKIIEFLFNHEEKLKMDKECAQSKTIQTLPLNVSIGYQAYKGRMLASGRDFLYVATHVRNKEDGTIINCGVSIEHEDHPPVKKYVRAESIVVGWNLQPDKENENLTHCTYISSNNLKGSLPKMLTNSIAKDEGQKIFIFRKTMQALYGTK